MLTTREPGGITISEHIRDIILNPDFTFMDARTEALLYAAARRQHMVEKIIPALKAGQIVICDRFIDSSLAYQGYARGIGMDEVLSINSFAVKDFMPSLTIFLELEPKKGLQRIMANKDRERNRLDLEKSQFHEKVYEGYKLLLNQFPHRIKSVNADQPLNDVKDEVLSLIVSHVKAKNNGG